MNYSQYLSKRVVIINEPIDDMNASVIVQQLINLNDESSTEDIYILIDSPGGKITSIYAIYDVIKWCKCDINTICVSLSASICTLLLSAGTKGKRYAFSEAEITPTLYVSANTESIYSSSSDTANKVVEKTIELFSTHTQNDFITLKSACLTEHMMTSNEAQANGFIDNVIEDKCTGVGMIKASKRYKFLKNMESIGYNSLIKKLESMGIIK